MSFNSDVHHVAVWEMKAFCRTVHGSPIEVSRYDGVDTTADSATDIALHLDGAMIDFENTLDEGLPDPVWVAVRLSEKSAERDAEG